MEDQLADAVVAAVETYEHSHQPLPVSTGKVTLRHPHTGDTVVLGESPAELIPYMGKGYQQVRG